MNFLLEAGFYGVVVRTSLPLGFAALGGLVCSRAGYLNIGIEGTMLIGSFTGVVGTVWLGSPFLGIALAGVVGIAVTLLLLLLSGPGRMGTVLAGVTIDIVALGSTSFFFSLWFPSGVIITNGSAVEPFLLVALAVAMGSVSLVLWRSRVGLIVRAVGEGADAAQAYGINSRLVRVGATALGGVLISVGGAALTLVVIGSFSDDVTGGLGFVALACVVLGGWNPFGVLVASVFFGFTGALQFWIGQGGSALAADMSTLPYLTTVLAFALVWGRRGPVEENRGLNPEL